MATNVQQQMEDVGNGSVALGAGMMLVGVLLGLIWVWLTFFRRSKSPRNGMTGSSGQVSEQSSKFRIFLCAPIIFFFPLILPETIRSSVHVFCTTLRFFVRYLMYALL